MAKEYIERRLLLDEVEKVMDESEYYGEWEDVCFFYDGDILDAIEKVPTADVQEVRHGKWIKKQEDIYWGNPFIRRNCSICGVEPFYQEGLGVYNLTPYCPNCGAKMDKE